MVSHFSATIDVKPLIEDSINMALEGLFPMQNAIFEEDWKNAKKATGFLIEFLSSQSTWVLRGSGTRACLMV
eukprot:COSAG02_NODE_190_length_30025_cov_22.989875_10_plen_72_part_00